MSFAPSASNAPAAASTEALAAERARLQMDPRAAWLWTALAMFIVVKLAWAFIPAGVMGIPRLGDDALVYLWSAASSVVEPRLDTPAIRDILALRQAQDHPSAELEFARARVTMRTTGVTASPVALLAAGLLGVGMGHNLTFAVVEAVIAVLLAFAIAFCLARVVSSAAAAVTLALLTLAILPNQGLHYLIASIFVLSLGLVLWTIALKEARRWPLLLLLAVIMLLSHPIGAVYVLVAVAVILGQAVLQRELGRARIVALLGLGAAFPLWLAISAAAGARAPMTAGMGGLSLEAAAANAAGLALHLKALVLTQPVLAALTAAGLLRAVRQLRENRDAFILTGVLLGVVMTTVVVDIPGYPGELPSRALVALVIVCTAVAAGWILEASRGWPHRSAWVAGVLALAVIAEAPLFLRYAMGNINSRHQVYDAALLRKELAGLPAGAAVVWMDTDVAMMAGLIEGADRLRAIPYPMLHGAAALRPAVAQASHVYVATVVPERLNGTSTIGAWSLQPRFHGYDFRWFRRVTLQADAGWSLPEYVRIEGPEGSALRILDGEGRPCEMQRLANGWVRVSACTEQQRLLHLESDVYGLRLTGVSMRQPASNRPWPWGEPSLRLRAEPRTDAEAPQLRFNLSYLLGESVAAAILAELGPLELVSSNAGVVWFRAAVPPMKKQ